MIEARLASGIHCTTVAHNLVSFEGAIFEVGFASATHSSARGPFVALKVGMNHRDVRTGIQCTYHGAIISIISSPTTDGLNVMNFCPTHSRSFVRHADTEELCRHVGQSCV